MWYNGVNKSVIKRPWQKLWSFFVRKREVRWLPDTRDLAYQDYLEGMKYKDIAKKYGVSLGSPVLEKRELQLCNQKSCNQKERPENYR